MDALSGQLPRAYFFLRLLFAGLVFIREPVCIHNEVGESIGFFGHHVIRDVIQMEQITKEVCNDPHSFW